MKAWVCFNCPGHGTTPHTATTHSPARHVREIVDTETSHRWATIHGKHPRKKGSCTKQEHLELKEAQDG